MNKIFNNSTFQKEYAKKVRGHFPPESVDFKIEYTLANWTAKEFSILEFCQRNGIQLVINPKLEALGTYGLATDTITVRELDTIRGKCVFLHELGHRWYKHGGYKSFKDYVRKEVEADGFMYQVCDSLSSDYQSGAEYMIQYSGVSRKNYDKWRKSNQKRKKFKPAFAAKLKTWYDAAQAKVDALQKRFEKNGNLTVGKWLEAAKERAEKAKKRHADYVGKD